VFLNESVLDESTFQTKAVKQHISNKSCEEGKAAKESKATIKW
jgi:hypothetical protein